MTGSRYAINLPEDINIVEIEDYDKSLLHRLGGVPALEGVLEMFINAVLADPYLLPFFDGVHPAVLKFHQKKFLSLAFTQIPADFDAQAFLIERHYRLFAMGLNETHFDRVVMHLESALAGMWVEPAQIAETKEHLAPFRAIFEQASREYVKGYIRAAVASADINNDVNGGRQATVV